MENQIEQMESRVEKQVSYAWIGVLLAVLFLPLTITFLVIYFVFFRICKWTTKATLQILLPVLGILAIIFTILQLTVQLSIIVLYLAISLLLGSLSAILCMWLQEKQIKKHPEWLKVPNTWLAHYDRKMGLFEQLQSKKYRALLKTDELYGDIEKSPIGVDENQTITYSYYADAVKARLITGAVGSGKTITLMNLIYNDILAGLPVFVVDFKKGYEFPYFLSKLAKEQNRKFYHFTTGGKGTYNNPYCEEQATYDPFTATTVSEVADALTALRDWDKAADVYKNQTKTLSSSIARLLAEVNQETTKHVIPWHRNLIAQIAAATKPEHFMTLVEVYASENQLSQDEQVQDIIQSMKAIYDDLKQGTKSVFRPQLSNLQSIFTQFITSDYAPWLSSTNSKLNINLFEFAMSDEAPIVLFQFNPNAEPELAEKLGTLIAEDLRRVSAKKQAASDKRYVGVYIDEAQTLNPEIIQQMAAKMRSANMFMTASVQSLEQLKAAATGNSEATVSALLDVINTLIIHHGATGNTAEKISDIVGKHRITDVTITGKAKNKLIRLPDFQDVRFTLKEVEVNRLESQALTSLSAPLKENNYKAEAMYITKSTKEKEFATLSHYVARKIELIPNQRVLEEVPEEFKQAMQVSTSSGKTFRKKEPIVEQPKQITPINRVDEDIEPPVMVPRPRRSDRHKGQLPDLDMVKMPIKHETTFSKQMKK